ncbi:beta-ketoacyl synthase [Sinomicrobium pectinilyticum]|uniref:Beta-ketoacyl synthase n=1 Tax=Sinomicrobium pectinilyticum TaxID=1084421 RepID=A0A3N0EKX5_SINP1|nr:beta-ketoacyl synthase N-terminal-like domain-containing protein [Sinomicrobium pectinilyticum]RNL88461.1 beta-ketoacyl synthase [Sinomicrobium pectinilyticum]
MQTPISITAISSVSSLGTDSASVWGNYLKPDHLITEKDFGFDKAFISALSQEATQEVAKVQNADIKYKSLDNSVLYALCASRNAVRQAGWGKGAEFGINIGSSRGATGLFEEYHKDFLERGKAGTLASPTTTLGNISSWVGHDLQSSGPQISHSITCSTALHALLNGVAWIRSGMVEKFLAGGSEAPLTPFTIAQMKALKVYAREVLDGYPCRALDMDKNANTMVLGEGAAVACLENGRKENALALIEGIGYATEVLRHNTSISTDADCFQRSMRMALEQVSPEEVDAIVMHAPGTVKGDSSEYNAIRKVFGKDMPALTTNKWKVGHSFGASGVLSLELGILMMQKNQFIPVPFGMEQEAPEQLRKVMVNAVGFGGNAVSVLLTCK